ncbi:hypothetical protein [Nitratiruptor sp. SB155-2]|uniref:hypothetical protein n=1 Tax=Nitratiruptor sp. (strain SB155-2) TaxID=387092 RepID=UPI0001586F28|nr:hypothetical protein [Nitratiruptor sp. SB155-2]BAF69559.1 hypothetical protein NIS_0445 [Nitratiruptor sp. SB155-2]BAN05316.1 hypothetical protein [Nitratiruptor phage NrS-1]
MKPQDLCDDYFALKEKKTPLVLKGAKKVAEYLKEKKGDKKMELMTYKEAAEALGIQESTVFNYVNIGKLYGPKKGYVTRESVQKRLLEKTKNLKRVGRNIDGEYLPGGIKKSEVEETFDEAMKKVEQVKPHRRGLKLIDLDTFEAALKAAYQQGRAEALKELESETITLDDVLNEYIPKVKEQV